MRPSSTLLASLVAFVVATSGCAAIEGIFKAGVWAGIIAVVLFGAIAAMVLGAFRR
jgi:hypothetical protein